MLVNNNPLASVMDANKKNCFIIFFTGKSHNTSIHKIVCIGHFYNMPCDAAFSFPVCLGCKLGKPLKCFDKMRLVGELAAIGNFGQRQIRNMHQVHRL
jgi:hypothetical protein